MRPAVLLVALAPSIALAEPGGPAVTSQSVALLPLDAGKSLELYGQPVASELARALAAGNIDVQIVGPKMAVPASARLIVDGTIKPGVGEAIQLAIRVRNPADGTVVDTLSATASSLSNIDQAAADLAARVVPVLRARLAVLDQPVVVVPTPPTPPPPEPRKSPPPSNRPLALVVRGPEVLRAALVPAAIAAAARGSYRAQEESPTAPASGPHLILEIRSYDVKAGAVPTARARVRVAAVPEAGDDFDRVIVTDTIVGDKGMSPEALAARVAEEVLVIARPYIKRVDRTWR